MSGEFVPQLTGMTEEQADMAEDFRAMQQEFFSEMCVDFVKELFEQQKLQNACPAEEIQEPVKQVPPRRQRCCDECGEWHVDVHLCRCGWWVCGWCKPWHDANNCIIPRRAPESPEFIACPAFEHTTTHQPFRFDCSRCTTAPPRAPSSVRRELEAPSAGRRPMARALPLLCAAPPPSERDARDVYQRMLSMRILAAKNNDFSETADAYFAAKAAAKPQDRGAFQEAIDAIPDGTYANHTDPNEGCYVLNPYRAHQYPGVYAALGNPSPSSVRIPSEWTQDVVNEIPMPLDDGTLTGESSPSESEFQLREWGEGRGIAAAAKAFPFPLKADGGCTELEYDLIKRRRRRFAQKETKKLRQVAGVPQAAVPREKRNKQRHRRGAVPGTTHSVTHIPADPDNCKICLQCKMQSAPKLKEAEAPAIAAPTEPRERGSTDLFGPTEETIRKERHGQLMRDHRSNYLKGGLTRTNNPTETTENYTRMTSREPSKFKVMRTDGGPEFEDEFHEKLVADGTLHELSQAGKPETNTGIERYVRIGVEGSRCGLVQSGHPYDLWGFSFLTFCRNFNVGTQDEEGNCPWVIFRPGRGEPHRAVPYGCMIWFLEPIAPHRKLDAKAIPGSFLCYGLNGTLGILDLKAFRENKTFRVVYTRDVAIEAIVFPLQGGDASVDPLALAIKFYKLMTVRAASTAKEVLDDGGGSCKLCGLSLQREPLRCRQCTADKPSARHKAHDGGQWCKRGRCGGHTKKEIVDSIGDEEVVALLENEVDENIVSVHVPGQRGEDYDAGKPPIDEGPEEHLPLREYQRYRVRVKGKSDEDAGDRMRRMALSSPPKAPAVPGAPGSSTDPVPSAPPPAVEEEDPFEDLDLFGADEERGTPAKDLASSGAYPGIEVRQPVPHGSNVLSRSYDNPGDESVGADGLTDHRQVKRDANGDPVIRDTPFGKAFVVQALPAPVKYDLAEPDKEVDLFAYLNDPDIDRAAKEQVRFEGPATACTAATDELLARDFSQYALVTKIIPLSAPEGRSAGALEALEKERYQLETVKKAWDVNKAIAKKDAAHKYPGCHFSRLDPILAIKHWETEAKRKFKARTVLRGNRIFTETGAQAEHEELYTQPINVPTLKLSCAHALAHPDFIEVQFDNTGAYPETPRDPKDPAMLVTLPRQYMTPHMLQMQGRGEQPHVPLNVYIYGEPNAGDKWDQYLDQRLTEQKWTRMATTAAGSIWMRDGMVLVVYVDDGKCHGPKHKVFPALFELQDVLPIDTLEWLHNMLGMHFFRVAVTGFRLTVIHQRDYAETLLSRFAEEAGGMPKSAHTPYIKVEARFEAVAGRFGKSCRRHIGGVLFYARCTRGDILETVVCLAREANKWTQGSDQRLTRCFGYMRTTIEFGTVLRMQEDKEADDLNYIGCSDSDHGGDAVTQRSTSGYVTGPGTERRESFMPVDTATKRQGATHRGSCGAEVASANDCTLRSSLPMMEVWDLMEEKEPENEDGIELIHYMDADSGRIVITGQRQSQLAYLRKHARIDLGLLRDIFAREGRACRRISGDENPSDLMTKMMKDRETFERHRKAIGVVDVSDYHDQKIDLGPVPERPAGRSMARRAWVAACNVTTGAVRAAANDEEIRGRALRWAAHRLLG